MESDIADELAASSDETEGEPKLSTEATFLISFSLSDVDVDNGIAAMVGSLRRNAEGER